MEVLNSDVSHFDARSGSGIHAAANSHLHLGLGSDLVDHANRLGIKLRSAGRVRPSPTTIGQRLSARRAATAVGNCRTWDVINDWSIPNSQTYVHNVIVPLSRQSHTDEENLQQSISRQSLSGSETKSALPHMRQSSARSNKSVSSYLDKYVSSTPNELQILKENKGGKKKLWNSSGQALRFQHEQESKDKSRTLQRTAVIQPHRLDRMYYISGTHLGMDGKYEVDDEEMIKLRDMARVRREATHYGRGLSSERRKLIGSAENEDIQIPRNPPNSQLDHVTDAGGRIVSPSHEQVQGRTPGGDAAHSNNLEGFALKGVGIEGGRKSNQTPGSFTVHVVNEDNLRTPQNSARTEQTNGNNGIYPEQLKPEENIEINNALKSEENVNSKVSSATNVNNPSTAPTQNVDNVRMSENNSQELSKDMPVTEDKVEDVQSERAYQISGAKETKKEILDKDTMKSDDRNGTNDNDCINKEDDTDSQNEEENSQVVQNLNGSGGDSQQQIGK